MFEGEWNGFIVLCTVVGGLVAMAQAAHWAIYRMPKVAGRLAERVAPSIGKAIDVAFGALVFIYPFGLIYLTLLVAIRVCGHAIWIGLRNVDYQLVRPYELVERVIAESLDLPLWLLITQQALVVFLSAVLLFLLMVLSLPEDKFARDRFEEHFFLPIAIPTGIGFLVSLFDEHLGADLMFGLSFLVFWFLRLAEATKRENLAKLSTFWD